MKTKIIAITLILLVQNLFAQSIFGTWYGNLDIPGQKLPLVIHIMEDGLQIKSTFDSPLQGATGIPIQKTTFENNEVSLEAPNLGINYRGKFTAEKIDGTFTQNGMDLPLVLTRNNTAPLMERPQEPKPPYSYNSMDVTFKNEVQGNVLAGTIAAPKNFDKNSPILVMITGSGVQNRDEELMGHKPFLVISDDLAKKGIATLRLDDRGIGGSEKGKDGATTADFATDINSAVNYLLKNGYKNIGLIGHSEGGMIAPMVADQNKNVKFIVLLAGPGIPIVDLFIDQNRKLMVANQVPKEVIDKDLLMKTQIFEFVKSYSGKDYQADLKKYLDKTFPEMSPEEEQAYVTQLGTNWMEYFLKFNPQIFLEKIKIPVLAVNGSLDLQVSAKENLAGIKKSLEKAENKHFETVEFEGLNHLFQTAKTGNPLEYSQITETFSPTVLNKISSWILFLK